jgi:hypothetical protein
MREDTAHLQLTAYLLSILVHHDRGIRAIGPPRNRQEWGIDRIGDYLRAIGREAALGGGEEALYRLIRSWAPLDGWLADQDIPAPVKPTKYRLPAA